MSRSFARRIFHRSALIVPPSICFWDNFYSTHRIKGKHMEPILQDGDIVLVKKGDFLPYYSSLDKVTLNDIKSLDDEPKTSTTLDQKTDRQHALRIDAIVGKEENKFALWRSPPALSTGDVIAFKSPIAFGKVDVKRVLGLNGQREDQKIATIELSIFGHIVFGWKEMSKEVTMMKTLLNIAGP
eukprot:CAMPEP_0194091860 /NCGR_PEP_ID=MMETSP0149-20130528/44765_1 /TAXON_ID=122233 /ORGANISM="Chaetoceros debilis, Strain MM31A-1" /LENGTH=183 /DNA_ID=CAMNT_0038776613 /DNA_START=44 /DNA_END=596 /DNA_ORIENTATION=+